MGQQLTRTGVVDRDIFVVLSGTLNVVKDSNPVGSLSRGDLFGEVAMFSSTGDRTADIVAETPCRLFVLRHRFLRRLERDAPEDAFLMYKHPHNPATNSNGPAFIGCCK